MLPQCIPSFILKLKLKRSAACRRIDFFKSNLSFSRSVQRHHCQDTEVEIIGKRKTDNIYYSSGLSKLVRTII